MVLKRYISFVFVTVFVVSLMMPQISAKARAVEFSDVSNDQPYASAVSQLTERKIIGGYPDGTFKPEASITRGQAAAIIAKLLNLDTKIVKNPKFKDVSPKTGNYGAIATVVEKGIFRGYADGRFGPHDQITRAQMSSILIKAFKFNTLTYMQSTPFKDIDRLSSHQESVYTLYKLGIAFGTSETTFSPNKPITRGEAAIFITKAEKVRSETIEYYAKDFGWSNFGYVVYSNPYEPEQNEEQVVQILQNKKASSHIQIVPIKEGTQKLGLSGRLKNDSNILESKKYYVSVTKENERFTIHFDETKDVLPTNVRLNVEKDPIKNVTLSTMDGTVIEESAKFKTCKEYLGFNQICLLLNNPGEYIATVEYANNTKIRYGVKATEKPAHFYLDTYSIVENPVVSLDLSKYEGDFSEYNMDEKTANIVNITREGNSNKFSIEGLSEGYIYVDFPKSRKEILGLRIQVYSIGSILNVRVEPYTYSEQFY